MMRKKGNGAIVLGISGVMGLLLMVGLLVPAEGGGSLDELARAQDAQRDPVRKGATGDPVPCANESLLSSFTQEGEGFVLIGTFLDVTEGGIAVDGPRGKDEISLDRKPRVEDDFYGGEAIRISGLVGEDDELEATAIRLACQEVLVQEIQTDSGPTAASAPPAQAQDAPPPPDNDASPPAPAAVENDSEKDKDDDKDEKPRGPGNGRGEGRGNGGGDDDDDDDD